MTSPQGTIEQKARKHVYSLPLPRFPFYSSFYSHVISRIPDPVVEKLGGPSFWLFSKVSQIHEPPHSPVSIARTTFPAVFGIGSGWADSPRKIKTAYQLGAGIVVAKTVTKHARKGNPYPRLIRGKDYLINSMGLPNHGIDWWLSQHAKTSPPPYIFSIKGNSETEWMELLEKSKHVSSLVELNFSCPNVKKGIMNIKEAIKEIKDLSSITHLPFFVKLSPEYSQSQLLELISRTREEVFGYTLFNTWPLSGVPVGNPLKTGGLSGSRVFPLVHRKISAIRSLYSSWEDLPLLAMGGITSPSRALSMFFEYKTIPLTVTGLLMKGPDLFYQTNTVIARILTNLELDATRVLYEPEIRVRITNVL